MSPRLHREADAVPIRFAAAGDTVEPGVPQALFATNIGSTVSRMCRPQYMVSADGQSFVLNSHLGDAVASPITVILNWTPRK